MMNRQRSEHDPKPLRRLRLERREAQARRNGYTGAWPPVRACVRSAADAEHLIARLESGEARATFLTAIGTRLVAFFEGLTPEHFRRLAITLLDIAQSPKTAHRSRVRAVRAIIKPLGQAITLLLRLEKAGQPSLQGHLESLLMAFIQELSTDDFAGLAALLVDLNGSAAKTTGDKLRGGEAVLATVTEAMRMLAELRAMQERRTPDNDVNDPEMRRRREEADAELAEMESDISQAEIQAGAEDERSRPAGDN
jgi:hypothetical protein